MPKSSRVLRSPLQAVYGLTSIGPILTTFNFLPSLEVPLDSIHDSAPSSPPHRIPLKILEVAHGTDCLAKSSAYIRTSKPRTNNLYAKNICKRGECNSHAVCALNVTNNVDIDERTFARIFAYTLENYLYFVTKIS